MSKYKFKGYTITNCGYHQPDHCVWWEAVNENGEACFHGNTLREVEFEILDYEWEQKIRRKDEEIERLKAMPVGNAALSVPPRQCDVGSAEEQGERFNLQCFRYHTGRCSPHCSTIPAKTESECVLKLAQTPYAEEGEASDEV